MNFLPYDKAGFAAHRKPSVLLRHRKGKRDIAKTAGKAKTMAGEEYSTKGVLTNL